jgi:hypothetical protein
MGRDVSESKQAGINRGTNPAAQSRSLGLLERLVTPDT